MTKRNRDTLSRKSKRPRCPECHEVLEFKGMNKDLHPISQCPECGAIFYGNCGVVFE